MSLWVADWIVSLASLWFWHEADRADREWGGSAWTGR